MMLEMQLDTAASSLSLSAALEAVLWLLETAIAGYRQSKHNIRKKRSQKQISKYTALKKEQCVRTARATSEVVKVLEEV
jgi:hypothetical protein